MLPVTRVRRGKRVLLWTTLAIVFLLLILSSTLYLYAKIQARAKLAEESSVVLFDQRHSIRSLRWKNNQLETVYCHEVIGPAVGIIYADRPWIAVHCLFFDQQEQQLEELITVGYTHDMAFFNRRSFKECIRFRIKTPTDARFIAIQHANGLAITNKVPIPDKVIDPWVDYCFPEEKVSATDASILSN